MTRQKPSATKEARIAEAVDDAVKDCKKLADIIRLPRKQSNQSFHIPLLATAELELKFRKHIAVDLIRIQFDEFDVVTQAHVLEQPLKCLSWTQFPQIVQSGVKREAVATIRIQVSTKLGHGFKEQDRHVKPRQCQCGSQSAGTTADDDGVIVGFHTGISSRTVRAVQLAVTLVF